MGDEEFDRRRCYGGSLQDGRSYRRDRERDYEGDRERRIRNNDYSNVSNLKRSGSGRRDDGIKRSRIDSACDSFEPQFNRSAPEGPIVPVMMTFKKFLATQDDSISGEDAISKYSEYKRKELQTFFDSHKDEEWFRFKYHPSETKKQKDAPLNLTILTEQDLANLGKKDPEKEVEKFIAANSVELAKDKWLCPLSGKKFRGPEFIKKHLTLKYQEQLDLIKVEAEFFNNYIADPKRPHEAEQKPLATPSSEDRRVHDGPSERERDGGHRSSYGDRSRYSGSNRSFGGYNRSRVYEPPANIRWDPRQPVSYRDLDAPGEIV